MISVYPQQERFKMRKGFTLLELVIVITIMILMAGLALPTFQSLNQPRRSALQELKVELESARTLALKEQTDVYVAFTDASPEAVANQFRRYGVFKPDPNDLNPDPELRQLVQVGAWRDLGEGVLFALGEHFEVSSGDPILTVIEAPVRRPFPSGIGQQHSGVGETPIGGWVLPFIMFGSEGLVKYPQFFDRGFLHVGVLEGFVENREIVPTRVRPGLELDQDFPQADCLKIDLYSGRARLVTQ